MPCGTCEAVRRTLRGLAVTALVGWPAGAILAEEGVSTPYATRSDWTSFTRGKLNISSFVYRDMNRNGIYDVGDRPMEDIAVEMTAPDGRSVVSASNSNGFSNFSMSVFERGSDISNAGEYRFEVIPPDGWTLTSDNAVQSVLFEVFPGAVADIVARQPFSPVGLAPERSISGAVFDRKNRASPTELAVVAVSPSGARQDVELDGNGQFSFPAEPGSWVIEVKAGTAEASTSRSVLVGETPVRMSTIVLGAEDHDAAPHDGVVDFDTITGKSIAEIPTGIGGLTWQNFVALKLAPGYTNGAMSGDYVAYNSSGHPVSIRNDEPFDFRGGYFSVSWRRAENETLAIRAWRGDLIVYEDEFRLSHFGPLWFDADYRSVTRIDFATRHYWQFVCDDLSFGFWGPPAQE